MEELAFSSLGRYDTNFQRLNVLYIDFLDAFHATQTSYKTVRNLHLSKWLALRSKYVAGNLREKSVIEVISIKKFVAGLFSTHISLNYVCINTIPTITGRLTAF